MKRCQIILITTLLIILVKVIQSAADFNGQSSTPSQMVKTQFTYNLQTPDSQMAQKIMIKFTLMLQKYWEYCIVQTMTPTRQYKTSSPPSPSLAQPTNSPPKHHILKICPPNPQKPLTEQKIQPQPHIILNLSFRTQLLMPHQDQDQDHDHVQDQDQVSLEFTNVGHNAAEIGVRISEGVDVCVGVGLEEVGAVWGSVFGGVYRVGSGEGVGQTVIDDKQGSLQLQFPQLKPNTSYRLHISASDSQTCRNPACPPKSQQSETKPAPTEPPQPTQHIEQNKQHILAMLRQSDPQFARAVQEHIDNVEQKKRLEQVQKGKQQWWQLQGKRRVVKKIRT